MLVFATIVLSGAMGEAKRVYQQPNTAEAVQGGCSVPNTAVTRTDLDFIPGVKKLRHSGPPQT